MWWTGINMHTLQGQQIDPCIALLVLSAKDMRTNQSLFTYKPSTPDLSITLQKPNIIFVFTINLQ